MKIKDILSKHNRAKQPEKGVSARHVLLGEDDPEMAASLCRALNLQGHRVTTVINGPAVLEAAPTQKPDVVLLKHYLTGLNGGPVASLLRAMPTTASTPIVVYNTATVGASTEPGLGSDSRDVDRYLFACDCADILDAVQRVLASP